MKQFFKMFFACMLAFFVIGAIITGIGAGLLIGKADSLVPDEPTAIIQNHSVLQINMDRRIHEQSESNSIGFFLGEDAYAPGVYDCIKALEYAKKDKDIDGILIRIDGSPNGWATLSQVKEAIEDFKSSGKFVYAYGEVIPQKSYYLASAADSVYLHPSGYMELKGVATVLAFFKGTLEKLEVTPEIFYAGKFKSATEPFRAEKISDANREQIVALQQDIWNSFLEATAAHTKADTATIMTWVRGGMIQTPEDALQNKLVNGLKYWDEVENLLREKTARKPDEKIHFAEMSNYAAHVKRRINTGKDKIAVLFAEGEIVDGKSDESYQIASQDFSEQIRKIKKDKEIKAVVLRVNSPGGSALASEVILRELQLLQKEKPLIVSMGDLAASGGYYISCQADSIFALPNTITGSIGVFAMLFNSQNLLKNKLGITMDEVKNAPYADFPSVVRPMTAGENQRMQNQVDRIYTLFKTRVSEGRKMDIIRVDSVAQGRVWTGEDALGLGLVDKLGSLDDAISCAARMVKIKDYGIKTFPRPADKMDAFLRRFSGMDASSIIMKNMIEKETGMQWNFMRQVKSLSRMNGRNMMCMPFIIGFE